MSPLSGVIPSTLLDSPPPPRTARPVVTHWLLRPATRKQRLIIGSLYLAMGAFCGFLWWLDDEPPFSPLFHPVLLLVCIFVGVSIVDQFHSLMSS